MKGPFRDAFGVCLLAFLSTSVGGAEFDGRLPAEPGEPLLAPGAFPAAAGKFLRERGRQFHVYWDHLLDTPRYLSPRRRVLVASRVEERQGDLDSYLVESARRFVDTYADFFGVSSRQLSGPVVRAWGRHRLLVFRQLAGGIPIRGANLRMVLRTDGTLGPVKAFLLRRQPGAPPRLAPVEPVRRLLAERHRYEVIDSELQQVFPDHDPGSSRPTWRLRVRTPGGDPGEVFADAVTGELIEARRFLFELGVLEGTIRGISPDPDPEAPNFFFQTPEEFDTLTPHPVPGALIATPADVARADAQGFFQVLSAGVATDVDWFLRLAACKERRSVRLGDGSRWDVCPMKDLRLESVLDVRGEIHTGTGLCVNGRLAGESADESNLRDLQLDLMVNPRGQILPSASLMSFHHLRWFLEKVTPRLEGLAIDTESSPPLTVVILDAPQNTRHYHPDPVRPRVCFSYKLKHPLGLRIGPEQWLTPMLLYHELAHDVIFRITGTLQSVRLDCFNDGNRGCVEFVRDPDVSREASIIEGATDALVAYTTGNTRFGYYAEGTVPGPLAYDIDEIDGRLADAARASVAKLFWEIRANFLDGQRTRRQRSEAMEAASNLLYHWLAFHAVTDGADRAFAFSPSLLDELLDIDDSPRVNGDGDGRRENGTPHEARIRRAFRSVAELSRVPFRRGDADQDGHVNLTDVVQILGFLFHGLDARNCVDAMDTDDRGDVVITDAVYLLTHLFLGGPTPPPPFDACALDPTVDDLVCIQSPRCSLP